jgi:hypothetical protein
VSCDRSGNTQVFTLPQVQHFPRGRQRPYKRLALTDALCTQPATGNALGGATGERRQWWCPPDLGNRRPESGPVITGSPLRDRSRRRRSAFVASRNGPLSSRNAATE